MPCCIIQLCTHRKMLGLSEEHCTIRSRQTVTFWSTVFVNISLSTSAAQDQVRWACVLTRWSVLVERTAHPRPRRSSFWQFQKGFKNSLFSFAFNVHWRLRDLCTAPGRSMWLRTINIYMMMMMMMMMMIVMVNVHQRCFEYSCKYECK